jgi:hypothetical protein
MGDVTQVVRVQPVQIIDPYRPKRHPQKASSLLDAYVRGSGGDHLLCTCLIASYPKRR